MPSDVVRGGRVGPPTAGVPGTLYDFVRRFLCDHGGSATRAEVRAAIMSDSRYAEKLERSRGFHSLISNMHHSGDIELDGPTVRATGRTYRRLGFKPLPTNA
jgi:hypothetical protein